MVALLLMPFPDPRSVSYQIPHYSVNWQLLQQHCCWCLCQISDLPVWSNSNPFPLTLYLHCDVDIVFDVVFNDCWPLFTWLKAPTLLSHWHWVNRQLLCCLHFLWIGCIKCLTLSTSFLSNTSLYNQLSGYLMACHLTGIRPSSHLMTTKDWFHCLMQHSVPWC